MSGLQRLPDEGVSRIRCFAEAVDSGGLPPDALVLLADVASNCRIAQSARAVWPDLTLGAWHRQSRPFVQLHQTDADLIAAVLQVWQPHQRARIRDPRCRGIISRLRLRACDAGMPAPPCLDTASIQI